jgi:hypothetical protein
MQREIKFRAWHKNAQEFTDLDFDINDYNFGWMVQHDGSVNPDYFIFQQFTGLKDINEKEIYEGDLLNIGANEFGFVTNNKGENVIYEVKFEGCEYILFRTDLNFNWGRLSRLDELCWNCQIVGNVHEVGS